MPENLQAVLSEPFLLIQIGDYGHGYEEMPIPSGLAPEALKRQQRGEPTYPMNFALPYPHFHVPMDIGGILMMKTDELRLNGFAYWAQNLCTLEIKRCCVNARQDELLRFSKMVSPFWAVLVTKKNGKPTIPKGNPPGRVFERWTPSGYVRESPTGQIKTDIVYTEAKEAGKRGKHKDTLLFDCLETLPERTKIDLNDYHVFFTPLFGLPSNPQHKGKKLPYRSSMYGTCSLLKQGKPDNGTDIPKLPDTARYIVAIATIHKHVCGRVLP